MEISRSFLPILIGSVLDSFPLLAHDKYGRYTLRDVLEVKA